MRLQSVARTSKAIDEWAPGYIAENSERILGKRLTLQQAKLCYRPCLRVKEGYEPLLHCKLTTSGPQATAFWDSFKKQCDPPDNWRDARMLLKLCVPHLRLSGGLCGFVINALDCQVVDNVPPPCPF
jgi:hypothetical protein